MKERFVSLLSDFLDKRDALPAASSSNRFVGTMSGETPLQKAGRERDEAAAALLQFVDERLTDKATASDSEHRGRNDQAHGRRP